MKNIMSNDKKKVKIEFKKFSEFFFSKLFVIYFFLILKNNAIGYISLN